MNLERTREVAKVETMTSRKENCEKLIEKSASDVRMSLFYKPHHGQSVIGIYS